MADTGGTSNICGHREFKTVMSLDPSCKLDSMYEIWANTLNIRNAQGNVVATAVVSTAVFDPITVMDPANTTRLVYTWDPAVDQIMNFPYNDRTYVRGGKREGYHGPTYWYNQLGTEVYYTDAHGMVMPGGTLKQEISRHNSSNFVATNDGLAQFKHTSNHCASGLSLKN